MRINNYGFENEMAKLEYRYYGILAFIILPLCVNANPKHYIDKVECAPYELAKSAFDYRKQHGHTKWLAHDIWQAHIQPAIQQMQTVNGRGIGGSASGNLDYALRWIPNDPRSLKAVIDYSFIIKTKPQHILLIRPPECYLQQAIRFASDDPMPRFLYGYYLSKKKQYESAIIWYKSGLKIAPDSSEGHYNLGLILVRLKRYSEAREHARIAYRLGYPLPWLRDKLLKLGYPVN